MRCPNVLLIVLDSVRARNVGSYGYYRDTTPFLSRYADQATLYTQARSPGIHSVATHASLWTGTHVEQHQMKEHENELKPGTTVWDRVAEAGYETGLFTTNPIVAHSSNLSHFFDYRCTDSFVDQRSKLFPDAHAPTDVSAREGVTGNFRRSLIDNQPLRSLANSAYHLYKKRQKQSSDTIDSATLVKEFLSWATETDGPWAACINLMDAHLPYSPDLEYDRWGGERLRALQAVLEKPPSYEFVQGRPWWQLEALESLYDGSIREADDHVRRTIAGLRERGLHDDTLVVVTSDHGEGFAEVSRVNGRTRLVDHSWGIDEVLTHVPLVVKYPKQSTSETVEDLATLVEFPDTVAAALEGSVGRDSFVRDGPAVVSTVRLRPADDGIFDDSEESAEDYHGPWKAIYKKTGSDILKFVRWNNKTVLERIHSPGCSTVVGTEDDDPVEPIFAELPALNLKRASKQSVPEDVEDRLTELGYLR